MFLKKKMYSNKKLCENVGLTKFLPFWVSSKKYDLQDKHKYYDLSLTKYEINLRGGGGGGGTSCSSKSENDLEGVILSNSSLLITFTVLKSKSF